MKRIRSPIVVVIYYYLGTGWKSNLIYLLPSNFTGYVSLGQTKPEREKNKKKKTKRKEKNLVRSDDIPAL